MTILARSLSKVTITHIILPRAFFQFSNLLPKHYNEGDSFFVKIDPLAFFESLKLMECDQVLRMNFEDNRIVFNQKYNEEKLQLNIEKQTIVSYLQDNEENDFPLYNEEKILEFKILNVKDFIRLFIKYINLAQNLQVFDRKMLFE